MLIRKSKGAIIVARAWLRVIWACWRNATPYDPDNHPASQRLTAS
jgi:hypothetical protein